GCAVGVVDRVEPWYLLVARYVVLLNLTVPGSDSPGSHAESLLMRHAGLGQILHDAFERTWRRGVPFDQALAGDGEPALVGATTSARRPLPAGGAGAGRR